MYYTAIVDFSERKRADEAIAANESKSEFLANMSHEIRTPLGAIMGFFRLLKNPNISDEKRAKCIEVIDRNGEVLSSLVNDILDLSKVESGTFDAEKVEFSLPELLTDLKELFSLKASEKGLCFEVISGAIPEWIVSDPTRLRQILVNIIGNAIKFTEKGTIRVRAYAEILSPHFRRLVFEVHDTGAEIQTAQRARLFKKFSQADGSTTRKFGGTGLGLALSQKLARALGGDVTLSQQRLEGGNTFVVTVQAQVGDGLHVIRERNQKDSHLTGEGNRLSGLRILVVEDSEDNQLLIEHVLREQGAHVEFANDGKLGVSSALAKQHDLVLMDVQMPVMGGHEATRILRKQGYNVPIIALSANAMKEDREKSLNAGCDTHLTKPINATALTDTVRWFTQQHRLDS